VNVIVNATDDLNSDVESLFKFGCRKACRKVCPNWDVEKVVGSLFKLGCLN
jgi:hypothetical protein